MTNLRKAARGPRLVNGEKRNVLTKTTFTPSDLADIDRRAEALGESRAFYLYRAGIERGERPVE